MGAWSAGITGNDTAADLKYEYQAAFSRLPPEEAVARLDDYVRREMGEDDWPDYVYSLAQYMWKHGRLTEGIRQRAFALMDSGAGLELYEDAGTRKKREKVLSKFREILSSPQPEARPIRLKLYQKPVFAAGDVLAWRLRTGEGPFYPAFDLPEAVFRQADGYWMLLQKIRDNVCWQSAVVPEVRDIWPEFEVFDICSPQLPTMEDFCRSQAIGRVTGDGAMTVYRCHQVQVLGNASVELPEEMGFNSGMLFQNVGQSNDLEEVAWLWRRGACLRRGGGHTA